MMLELKNLSVSYGAITALHGISLSVQPGSVVTLIGANGAGKTTTLKTISGLLKPRGGEILYDGKNIAGLPPHQIVKLGLSHVPEGRMIFANLTVMENLQMGAYLQKDRQVVRRELEHVFTLFPRLQERERQIAGTLSGGEQQMLAIGRALMSQPRFLMLDEPSLGLAPLLVKTIFEKIVEINRQQGITILLVEQNANLALEVSHFGYVLETGKITVQGDPAALRQNPQVKSAYLGG
jgi:branched-chain amino acid transport system ATP-binding protein